MANQNDVALQRAMVCCRIVHCSLSLPLKARCVRKTHNLPATQSQTNNAMYSNVGVYSKDVDSMSIRYLFATLCLFYYFEEVRCIIFCRILRSPLHHFLSHITKSVASFLTKARVSRVHPPKTHTEVGCIHTMLPQVCSRQNSVKTCLI